MKKMLRLASVVLTAAIAWPSLAQESDEDEYRPELPDMQIYKAMLEANAEFYAALEARGFMLDWGEDGSGLGMKYHRRGSGYYIDTGASQLIIDGEIAVRSGVEIAELRPRSVVLTDGSEMPADLVV